MTNILPGRSTSPRSPSPIMELYHKNPISSSSSLSSSIPPTEEQALYFILTAKSLSPQRQILLQNILTQLRHSSQSSPSSMKEILSPLFRLDWRIDEWKGVKNSVIDLLIHITSIHPGAINSILATIIERIIPLPDHKYNSSIKSASTIFMEKVLLINPSSWCIVFNSLQKNIPFHKEDESHHHAFIDASLSLALLAPHGWGLKVLEMLISHFIVMDIELQQSSSSSKEHPRLSLIMNTFIKCLLEYFHLIFNSTPPSSKRLKGTMTVIPLISLILRKFDHYIFGMYSKERGSMPLLILSLSKEYPTIINDPLLGLLFKPMILICKLLSEGKTISDYLIRSGIISSSYIASFLKLTHDSIISKDLLLLSWSTISGMLQRLYMVKANYRPLFIDSLNYLMIIFINCHENIPLKEYETLFNLIFNGGGNGDDCNFLIDCNEDVLYNFIGICDKIGFEINVECETEDDSDNLECEIDSVIDDTESEEEDDDEEEDIKTTEKKILYMPFELQTHLPSGLEVVDGGGDGGGDDGGDGGDGDCSR